MRVRSRGGCTRLWGLQGSRIGSIDRAEYESTLSGAPAAVAEGAVVRRLLAAASADVEAAVPEHGTLRLAFSVSKAPPRIPMRPDQVSPVVV